MTFLAGPLIDRANFRNLYGIIYFDLRNQEEDVKDSVVSLTFTGLPQVRKWSGKKSSSRSGKSQEILF